MPARPRRAPYRAPVAVRAAPPLRHVLGLATLGAWEWLLVGGLLGRAGAGGAGDQAAATPRLAAERLDATPPPETRLADALGKHGE